MDGRLPKVPENERPLLPLLPPQRGVETLREAPESRDDQVSLPDDRERGADALGAVDDAGAESRPGALDGVTAGERAGAGDDGRTAGRLAGACVPCGAARLPEGRANVPVAAAGRRSVAGETRGFGFVAGGFATERLPGRLSGGSSQYSGTPGRPPPQRLEPALFTDGRSVGMRAGDTVHGLRNPDTAGSAAPDTPVLPVPGRTSPRPSRTVPDPTAGSRTGSRGVQVRRGSRPVPENRGTRALPAREVPVPVARPSSPRPVGVTPARLAMPSPPRPVAAGEARPTGSRTPGWRDAAAVRSIVLRRESRYSAGVSCGGSTGSIQADLP